MAQRGLMDASERYGGGGAHGGGGGGAGRDLHFAVLKGDELQVEGHGDPDHEPQGQRVHDRCLAVPAAVGREVLHDEGPDGGVLPENEGEGHGPLQEAFHVQGQQDEPQEDAQQEAEEDVEQQEEVERQQGEGHDVVDDEADEDLGVVEGWGAWGEGKGYGKEWARGWRGAGVRGGVRVRG